MVDETRSRRDGSRTYAQSAVARIRATLPTWKNVRPVDGEVELVSGIWSIQAPGHSPPHTAHLLGSGGSQLLATADVSLHSASFLKNLEWQVAVDQVGPTALATRKRIFDSRHRVTGVHWLQPNIGTIAKDGNGYAFMPAT
jgi:glyoxylase-like metal-dependent hydrolase (beta-lactamase superfamily II)